jgi:hypothetical protein
MAKGKSVLITSNSSAALDVIRNKIAGEDGVFEDGHPMQKLIMSWGNQREAYTRFNAAKQVLKDVAESVAKEHHESSEVRNEDMTRSKAKLQRKTKIMEGVETKFREESVIAGKELIEMVQSLDKVQDRTLFDVANLIVDMCKDNDHWDDRILHQTPQTLAETIFKDNNIKSERTQGSFAFVISNDLEIALRNEETCKHLVKWFKSASSTSGSTTFLRSQVKTLKEEWTFSRDKVDHVEQEGGIGGGVADRTEKEKEFTEELQSAGLKTWAQHTSKVICGQIEMDDVIPPSWEESFVLLICKHFLVSLKDKVPCASMDDEQIKRRKMAEDSRQVDLKEMVTKETQRHVIERYKSMDPKILEEFASKLHESCLGAKGRGARSKDRVQRRLQTLLEDGKLLEALPIWIMPTEFVSEILPSTLGLFDLVILEEASQSDCLAIPALMRGTKLVIIGDNQQVNPRQSTDSFKQMIEKNLTKPGEDKLPQRTIEKLLPGTSVFDLFAINFAGPTTIALREHFRCCFHLRCTVFLIGFNIDFVF